LTRKWNWGAKKEAALQELLGEFPVVNING
jgi:hypothetical protein